MKNILMTELEIGDIFTHELKLHNRKAFKVTKANENNVMVTDRATDKEAKKQKKDTVIFLRNED